jgi:CBS domain-containing protein
MFFILFSIGYTVLLFKRWDSSDIYAKLFAEYFEEEDYFMKKPENNIDNYLYLDISDEDIYKAMKDISGYLDITPEDFKNVYRHAYRHAFERIVRSVKAGDVMTRKVVSVKRETSLEEVAEIMAEKDVSGVPVIEEDGKVAGVISEKDFLLNMGAKNTKTFMGVVAECLKAKGCIAVDIRAKKAEDIMTSPPITVTEDTTLLDVANILKEKKINRVPVVDQNSYLIGIVSRGDIVEAPLIKGKS